MTEHEAINKIKFIVDNKDYPDAVSCDYDQYYGCELALKIKDIEDVLYQLNLYN